MSQPSEFFTRTPPGGGPTVMFVRAGDAAWLREHSSQPFDAARVACLRAAIAAGTYEFDPLAVADGLLGVERVFGARQFREAYRHRALHSLLPR